MRNEFLSFNGVNGATGSYLFPPIDLAETRTIARNSHRDREELVHLRRWRTNFAGKQYGLRYGGDPLDLSSSGWGLITPVESDPAIREALAPLLSRRRSQAGDRYRELEYQPNESKREFLQRLGARADGPADPDRVPYYLLIVGDPEAVPFEFQYQLDVQYAVGRLHFAQPAGYDAYARGVLEAERLVRSVDRRAVVFAVHNPGDVATELSATWLAPSLAAQLGEKAKGWQVDLIEEDQATRPALQALLRRKAVPALLFTAGHGAGFPRGHPDQLSCQGALVCGEWRPSESAEAATPPPRETYLAGEDVDADARLFGLISMHFACYGAGTPRTDDYSFLDGEGPAEIAPRPFVAYLPQRLLSQGALAVIGHIDRGWSFSFSWDRAITDPALYVDALASLADGHPVGYAMEPLNERYAELATDVNERLGYMERFPEWLPDEIEFSELWAAQNDARATVVLGDPAVRLPLDRRG